MDLALAQARLAAAQGEVPVGAVLALGDEVLAATHNRVVADRDPTAHAEMLVIRAGARRLGNERLVGTTLVATLEPCPMCLGAAVLARVERLVYGAFDSKAGAAGSVCDLARNECLNHRLEVVAGLKAEESARLLREFFKGKRRGAGAVERARLEIE
ncbi:MAG: nucleoside deaminase [Deltaproteobacteria bacterium]|nr:nucleoside deaminase [Deltaproteobacteria bacterium]